MFFQRKALIVVRDTVPLSTLVTMKTTAGPEFTNRFSGYREAQINGILAPWYSSGQGRQGLEEVFAQTMPRDSTQIGNCLRPNWVWLRLDAPSSSQWFSSIRL